MSALSSPQTGGSAGPKQMSSRLSNMKFMQRAAFTGKNKISTTPQTPGSEPPLKRRRTGDDLDSNLDSPASYTSTHTPTHIDRFPIAPSRIAAETPLSQDFRSYDGEHYETHWVLDNATIGHSNQPLDPDLNSEEDDIWAPANTPGVQTYGAFKKKGKSKPPSVSKSARRNAARKLGPDDPDDSIIISSGSDTSNSDSDSKSDSDSDSIPNDPHEPNIYSRDRDRVASHKYKSHSSSQRPLSSYKPQHSRDQRDTNSNASADFMRFDRDTSPRGYSDAVRPSRGKFFDTLSERKSANNTPDKRKGGQGQGQYNTQRDRDRDFKGGKKRKTM